MLIKTSFCFKSNFQQHIIVSYSPNKLIAKPYYSVTHLILFTLGLQRIVMKVFEMLI